MPIIIPGFPARPAPNTPSITLSGAYSVGAGTTLYREGDWEGGYDLFYSTDFTATLNNAGLAWIRGTTTAYGIRAFNIGAITNSGTIIAEATGGDATGLYMMSGWFGGLDNSGTILAYGQGNNRAWGIRDWSSSSVITNSGTIAVYSGNAVYQGYAIQRNNGGQINNTATGQILAEGPGVIAILTRAWLNTNNSELINAGRIEALSTNGDASVAVSIDSVNPNVGNGQAPLDFNLVNSGIIKGDWAIFADSYSAGSTPREGIEVVSNLTGGQIIGDIFLDLGNDRIENAGSITGSVDMGEGDDTIDTRTGVINGVSYMGWGADTYQGGPSPDYVLGEWGDDQIEGNGGQDLLIGDYGNDRLVGGAGNDGLYGSFGNDTLVTQAGDVALGGFGNDRIELGDFTFWYADGETGFDTLVLPTGTRLFDLSAALATNAIRDFEALELRGGVEIVIRAADVTALTGSETEFLVTGTATDKVDLVGAWTASGSRTVGTTTYSVFTLSGVNVLVANGLATQVLGTVPGGAVGLDPAAPGKGAPLPGDVAGTGLLPSVITVHGYGFYLPEAFAVDAGTTWRSFSDDLSIGVQTLILGFSGSFQNDGTITARVTRTQFTTIYDAAASGVVAYNTGTLTNNGVISAESGFDPFSVQAAIDHVNNYTLGRLYNNEFGGLAMGIQIHEFGTVENYGLVEAIGHTGPAIGTFATGYLSPTGYTVYNRGQIRAQSDQVAAIGATSYDAMKLWNAAGGTITVQAGYTAVGVGTGTPVGEVRNEGTITVAATGADPSRAYGVWIGDNTGYVSTGTFKIINSGTIDAAYAVYVGRIYNPNYVEVTNTGLMTGGLLLGPYADKVFNTGTIGGAVQMGAGDDLFDGRGGTQNGKVDGGNGNDTLYGGSFSDRLAGGNGDDTFIGGGGNDIFFGDAGTGDVVRYAGNRADYLVETVTIDGAVYTRVTGQGTAAGDGADLLRRIESIQFADQTLALGATPNNQPTLGPGAIVDRSIDAERIASFQLPANAFIDSDPEDVPILRATMADGSPLIGFLTLDSATRTFNVVGASSYYIGSQFVVRVYAEDGDPDTNYEIFDDFVVTVVAGEGPDQVGTAGNDFLQGTFRIERLFGLGGDDYLNYSAGPDSYDGGPGNDILTFGGAPSGITIQLGATTGQFISIENVHATEFADTVYGEAGANEIRGNGGDDTLFGFGGDDLITGGSGNDLIDGGEGTGDVAIFSRNRSDYLIEYVLEGGTAKVRVTGLGWAVGDGVDLLTGVEIARFFDQDVNVANARPVLGGVTMPDQAIGDGQPYGWQIPADAFVDPNGTALSFAATLSDGSPLPAWLTFNPATRTFSGTPPFAAIGTVLEIKVTATDNFPGDPLSMVSDVFALTIVQAPGADVTGTANADTLSGTFRAERMFGLDSDDIFNGSGGADQLDGGNGTDTADYSASAGAVSVNLATGAGLGGDAAGDSYVSIENVRGSAQGDTLTGNALANVLTGNGGIDTLDGGAGNDRLVISAAGSGSNVNGGANTDTLAVSGAVSLGTVAGIEAIEMTGAALTLTGTQVSSGFALTTAVSGTGSLTINMTAGQLLGTKFWTIASGIAVTINGTSGTDIMKLGNVVQTVNGGDGTDQIKGGSAVDTINGGAGIDKIMGLGGADILTGGAGNDVFRYLAQSDSGLGAAADRITDFTIGQDRLNFVQIDADAATAGDQAFAFIGTSAFSVNGLGQIRYQDSGADLLVMVDVNGDGAADMSVILQGLAGQVLGAGQFVL